MNQVRKAVIGMLYLLGLAVAAVSFVSLWIGGRPGASSLLILTVAYVPYAAVGSILVARRPRNLIGWVLIGMGWTFAVSFLPMNATAQELQTMTASPLQEAIAWLTEVAVSLVFALFALLAFCYPTGRLPRGRWRRPAALVLVVIWGTVVISAFWPVLTLEAAGAVGIVEFPNPIGLLRFIDFALPSQSLGGTVLPFVMLASLAAIVGRYRGSRDLERLQMRWLVASFGGIALAVIAGLAIVILGFDQKGEVAWVPAAAAFVLPPLAIGFAVTRYRLYEIDRIISRGLSWAVLSGLLLAVYGGAILLLQTVLGDVIRGQTLAVAGSTLVAAALFQPLRRRVQAAVDHRFNRARYNAERTAVDFAERLRGEVDLASLSGDITRVVNTALSPKTIGVWIRSPQTPTP